MKVYRNISPLRWLVAAMLVGTAQFAIAPRAVEARCGDYVMHGGHGKVPATMSIVHADQFLPTHRDPLNGGRCSGPNCSNDDSGAPQAPAAPIAAGMQQWGLIAGQWLKATVDRQFARFADEATQLRMLAGFVFRPPR